jgi:hypothetical protein
MRVRQVGKQTQYFGPEYQGTSPGVAYCQFMETIMDLDNSNVSTNAHAMRAGGTAQERKRKYN